MTLLNERKIETWYFRADSLLDEGEFAEAKELLLILLEEEPGYALAHNHLGWIYLYHLRNYRLAETHLKFAMKFADGYPSPFMNYALFLYESNRFAELESFADEAMTVPGTEHSTLLGLKGNALEFRGQYRKAFHLYRQAKQLAYNEDALLRVQAQIDRINSKMNLFQRIALVMF
jgi:tetratricopeptide (TPR) repeat protein